MGLPQSFRAMLRSPDTYGIMYVDDLFCMHKSTCIGLPQHCSETLWKTTMPGFYSSEKIHIVRLIHNTKIIILTIGAIMSHNNFFLILKCGEFSVRSPRKF